MSLEDEIGNEIEKAMEPLTERLNMHAAVDPNVKVELSVTDLGRWVVGLHNSTLRLAREVDKLRDE